MRNSIINPPNYKLLDRVREIQADNENGTAITKVVVHPCRKRHHHLNLLRPLLLCPPALCALTPPSFTPHSPLNCDRRVCQTLLPLGC
ncbi:hypothetical protein K443DRAFT_679872 [Laccaria amethystina LaAM-08-1]|uniref:Uncharacterized protein n=1 Tax=Laccaria amethystina LaAM-08-1 TaxID=1095629 RepID=A0A0C9X3D9_9AGAR|nr:hypothetical protein K443DRAFT_679872 [Laccaria amethystina LaAM-08-1]